ncbi:MAG: hypothetical protein H0W56_00270 [Acidothermales bacterium]|jgi:hypothetical protein|nr:hypothetical protein [Acidothermales bacterium]
MDDYYKYARAAFCFFAVLAMIGFVGVALGMKWLAMGATAALVAGTTFAAIQRQ